MGKLLKSLHTLALLNYEERIAFTSKSHSFMKNESLQAKIKNNA